VDFSAGEAEAEISLLAAQVLAAGTRHPSGPSAASVTGDYDDRLWKELGSAGLLSLAVPAELGGDGLGVQSTAAVLTGVGRYAAEVPALSTLALGVLPVARSADAATRRHLLAGVAAGDTVLTAAIREPSDPLPAHPRTSVTGETVSGLKVGVPDAAAARWILIPASLDGKPEGVVAVVEPGGDGVSYQRTRSSSGRPEYTLKLDNAPVRHLLAGCDPATLYRLAAAGVCAVADGALAAALELTTEHVRSRQQFGRPLATFQAVAQQIADVYSAARTVHLATVSACWRLDNSTADTSGADSDTEVAAYWLARYGPAALRTCHQLHGGLGMDVTYPLPRFSALMTDLVALLGGLEGALDRLSRTEYRSVSA
jgi:3-oxo-4-pregnene-20-carboxyl-CoA dehydrogenase alpha subunit